MENFEYRIHLSCEDSRYCVDVDSFMADNFLFFVSNVSIVFLDLRFRIMYWYTCDIWWMGCRAIADRLDSLYTITVN